MISTGFIAVADRLPCEVPIVPLHPTRRPAAWKRPGVLNRTVAPPGPPGTTARDSTVTWTVTVLAGLAALVIALAPPAMSLLAARDRLDGALETSARLHAAEVAILASHTPAFWDLDGLHVSAPDAGDGTATPEQRRVYDVSGRLVLESEPAHELAWPVLSRSAPIMDGTRHLGEAEASRSFRQGVITTGFVALASCLGGMLIFIMLRVVPLRLLQQALERAVYLSSHDVLTGLPNRAVFADRLQQALTQAQRSGRPAAVLCIDLDRFKEINDTLGHAAGDTVLRVVSERIKGCLREGDTLVRLGGDEFAVIQPNVSRMDDAEMLAGRLLEAVECPIDINGTLASVGVSIGIALSEAGIDGAQLLQNADVALYRAKDGGRAQWCCFTHGMSERLHERRALEADLRGAVADQQFFLNYQPQVNLASGRVIGVEALLRWDRPGHGLMPPDQFIGVAEETGLIGAIGAWVLQEACRTAARWPGGISIAVNVSPAQFRLAHFHDAVAGALKASGLAPSRLELEITEGLLLSDTEETLIVLNGLRGLGVRFAMDDFGTGYSSLGYLQKFRFDKIKIDRSFILHLTRDPSAAAIVRAVLALGKAMGICTIAEGVETTAQAEMLSQEGCQEAQGYLYGRPMPADTFAKMLAAQMQRTEASGGAATFGT
jgi:diguanylate cyclase (GGDEF)-like protein